MVCSKWQMNNSELQMEFSEFQIEISDIQLVNLKSIKWKLWITIDEIKKLRLSIQNSALIIWNWELIKNVASELQMKLSAFQNVNWWVLNLKSKIPCGI